jgi:hypothetical protein
MIRAAAYFMAFGSGSPRLGVSNAAIDSVFFKMSWRDQLTLASRMPGVARKAVRVASLPRPGALVAGAELYLQADHGTQHGYREVGLAAICERDQ